MATEKAAIIIGNTATATGSGVALLLSLSDMVAIGGLVIAGLGLLVNIVYQHRRDRRERELTDEKINLVKRSTGRRAPPGELDL